MPGEIHVAEHLTALPERDLLEAQRSKNIGNYIASASIKNLITKACFSPGRLAGPHFSLRG